MTTILRHTFADHTFITAYAPFLKPGQVTDCPALINAIGEGQGYHRYRGKATVEYNSANAFLARLDNGKETFMSIGIVISAHWNLDDKLGPGEFEP